MNHIRTIRGQIDNNDLEHIYRLGHRPVVAEPCPIGGNGIINPHTTRFYSQDGTITDVFHIKPIYYEAIDHTWRPMSEVAVHHGNRNIVLKMGWARFMSQRYFQWLTKRQRLFPGKELAIEGYILQPAYYEYATTTTYYPDPHTETTSVDGDVNVDDVTLSGVWATVRDQSNADHALPSDSQVNVFRTEKLGGRYAIGRYITLFDTSSIGSGATISSATQSQYLNASGGDTTQAQSTNVVTSSPASNTDIVVGDYDRSTKWGSTKLCDTDVANTATKGAYIDFSFNATGKSSISLTGITKTGYRTTGDLSNTAPTVRSYWPSPTAENAGTSSDPKLVVTYTAASGPAKLKTHDTVTTAKIKTLDTSTIAKLKTVDTIV